MRFVLINGWSGNAAMWQSFQALFSDDDQIEIIDLDQALSADGWMEEIDQHVQDNDVLMGWSLGGELAIRYAAKTSKALRALCLLQTNPCFVQQEDWTSAMPAALFAEFDHLVNSDDMNAVLKQFSFMMVQGSDQLRSDRKALKRDYESQEISNSEVLIQGMKLLRNLDVRSELAQLQLPVLSVLGAEDQLVPVGLAESLASSVDSVVVIDGMAHLPCYTWREKVFTAMMEFINHCD